MYVHMYEVLRMYGLMDEYLLRTRAHTGWLCEVDRQASFLVWSRLVSSGLMPRGLFPLALNVKRAGIRIKRDRRSRKHDAGAIAGAADHHHTPLSLADWLEAYHPTQRYLPSYFVGGFRVLAISMKVRGV